MEAHIRKGCTMACNSVRVRGTRVGQVCHHSRVRSVSSSKGFVGIFWGTPAIYFADFGAILAIFDHFWAIFGLFLGQFFFLACFAEKWHFGPEISAES